MPVCEWIVFYDDGSSFSADDGKPEDAPREGVIVIAVADISCGRRLLHSQDTYCWQDGGWVPHSELACQRYLNQTKWPIRLCGYWVRNEVWDRAVREARKDPRLPEKTALHPTELE